MLALSDCLGTAVFDADGTRIGKLADLAAELADPYPIVTRLLVKTDRRTLVTVPWEAVTAFDPGGIRLNVAEGGVQDSPARANELLLGRHVLDAQIVDISGKRLVRVGDVELDREDGLVRLAGVEVGYAALFRRLGLRRIAKRIKAEEVDWRDLHLASSTGHALQLQASGSTIHKLSPQQLAELVARLPVGHATATIEAVEPEKMGEALSYLSAEHREKLLEGAAAKRAAELKEHVAKHPSRPGLKPRKRFKVMRARRRAPS